MIECNFCGKLDEHYSKNRDTSIGRYMFWYPYEYKYVCDSCMENHIKMLKTKNVSQYWFPQEIR